MSDDDDIIIVNKSPRLPTTSEIDSVVRRIVQDAQEDGIESREVKLRDCIEVA